MPRLIRPPVVIALAVLAVPVLLAGCSLFGASATEPTLTRQPVNQAASALPAVSPMTPRDYARPPAAAAVVTASYDAAQPTALGVVDSAGPFCTTARTRLKAWGGNPLAVLWSVSQSPDSASSSGQVKSYVARADSDTTALHAVAPPQIQDSIGTLRDAVIRLDADLRQAGYDLGGVGTLASAIALLTDPSVESAWLSFSSFAHTNCAVELGTG
jgi:hypothetical protein